VASRHHRRLTAIYQTDEITLALTNVDEKRPFSLQAAITHHHTLAELAATQPALAA
jgi:hypothetical protein